MNAPAKLSEIWVFLAQSPLLWLSLTLLAYLGALWLHARSGRNPMVNPVLVSAVPPLVAEEVTPAEAAAPAEGAPAAAKTDAKAAPAKKK